MVKIKLVVFLVAVSIAAGIPIKRKNQTFKEDYYKIFMTQQLRLNSITPENRFRSVLKREFMQQKMEIEKLNLDNFRLPNNTIPLRYEVRLATDIHDGNDLFDGTTRIYLRVLEASNTITIHSSRMLIRRIDLFSSTQSWAVETNLNFRADSTTQLLEIRVTQQLQPGQEFILQIDHAGFLRNDRVGFYRTSYRNPVTSETHWVASTLFEPTHARSAFPCYDEIRYRTPFEITIQHHPSYNALSNMPIASESTSGDLTTTRFQVTLPMPTYNVAFTVSNYDFISNENEKLPMRVYAQPDEIEDGLADTALELAEKYWNALEGLFEIPYPLPKNDLVAVDNWRNGESWGLLKINGWNLLDENEELRDLDRIDTRWRRLQIAHELTHTYFSNLVSPADWSFLWLNEGFATLYERIIEDIVEPNANSWEDFAINVYDAVLTLDSFGLLIPMNFYAETPIEINQKFNFESYQKGAVILRMLKDAVTEEVFVQGVKYYLNEMQLKSATPEDLFSGIQKAYDEAFPGNEVKINEFMESYLTSTGIPMLTVSRSENGLLLTQEAVGGDAVFSIPISYTTASVKDFDKPAAKFWMTTKELEIARDDLDQTLTDDDWIIFNLRDTGYYLTNYDDTLWDLIINSLANDHEAIHPLNRGTLFADIFRFIEHGLDFRATIFLDIVDSLKLEFNSHVWQRAANGLRIFERRLRGSELHEMYLQFLNDLMAEIYGRTLEPSNRWAVDVKNTHSCLAGVKACEEDALKALLEVRERGSTDYPFSFRCNAFRVADEELWMHFFNDAMSQTSGNLARLDALRDLECTQNPKLIQLVLETLIDDTNDLSRFEREDLLRIMAGQNHEGYNAVIEFVEKNHELINERTTVTTIGNTLSMLSTQTNTECQAEKVFNLIKFIPVSIRDFFDRAFFRRQMEPNLRFVSRNSEAIHEWLENYELNKEKTE